MTAGESKEISGCMQRYKKGNLHSGDRHGPVVRSRKQAIAIALSKAAKKKKR